MRKKSRLPHKGRSLLKRCSGTVSVRSATVIIQRWWNFFDINYSLLEVDEQADILAQYSKLINYFDPSVRFELVLFNRQVNEQMLTEQFDIPWQEDDFNDIREEYTEMLKKQAAKGNTVSSNQNI